MSAISASWAEPLPGLHNPRLPATAKELRPKAVRVLLFGRFLTQWFGQYRNGTIHTNDRLDPSPRNLIDISTYAKEGITVVVTPFLWAKQGEALPSEDSPEWKQHIDHFAEIIRLFGTNICYLTLDNEPTFERSDADLAAGPDKTSRVIRFYNALAARGQAEKRRNPALSNLCIVSPGFYGIEKKIDGTIPAKLDTHLMPLLEWAMTNADIDAIDIHAHLRSADELAAILGYLKQRTSKPVLINEWSQTPIAHEWLDKPLDSGYRSRYGLARMTPRRFISACYTNRVSSAQWNEFIALAPFEADYFQKSYTVASQFDVRVMLYPHGQWGSTEFDPNEILASRTVIPRGDGTPERNYQFFDRLYEIVKRYEEGAASSR
ncbi:MAG: hypothetical protein HZC28_06085 [Spirochaetes bacterium]|nr:hypothetical protein [Spirochaetota bacterium]